MDITAKKQINIEEQLKELDTYKYFPSALASIAINRVEDITNGRVEVVSPSNPFVYLLENMALFTAFGIQEDLLISKKLFPVLANNEDDLNRHMSDKDYAGRFSRPSMANVTFTLLYNDFLTNGYTDPATQDTILKIPRNYQLEVDGYIFTLTRPIIIRRTPMGVVDVSWANDLEDDLFPVDSNHIVFHISSQNQDERYLTFTVRLPEVSLKAIDKNINRGSIIRGDIQLPDNRLFYYMKVYYLDRYQQWAQMVVNHNAEVWDVNVPTCTIKVLRDERRVEYYIPDLYNKQDVIGDKIRIVLYTTRGEVNVNFADYLAKPDDFKPSYNKVFPELELDETQAPLAVVTKTVYINEKVIDGRGEKTFEQLKKDVINNNLQPHLPITTNQIEGMLSDTPFEPVKTIDVVTHREYLLKTQVPSDVSRYKVARMSLSVMEFKTSIQELMDNRNNITTIRDEIIILPAGTLFEVDDFSGIRILGQEEYDMIASLSGFDLVAEINSKNYQSLYYHYILDCTSNRTALRAYEIDRPSIPRTYFKGYNNTTAIGVNTKGAQITKVPTGYRIDLSFEFKQFDKRFDPHNLVPFIVLSGENGGNFFLEGRLSVDVQDAEVITFFLDTDYYIDEQHRIYIRNFVNSNGNETLTPLNLEQTVSLVYATNAVPNSYEQSDLDSIFAGSSYANDQLAVVTIEEPTLKFGDALDYLYTRVVSSVNDGLYETYKEDIPLRYKSHVYNKNNEIIHYPGDIVLNEDDEPIIQYHEGDVVLGQDGNPIEIDQTGLAKYLNLMLIDHRFILANSLLTNSYKEDVKTNLRSLLLNNMHDIRAQLNEVTEAYLTVPNSYADIPALVDGRRVLIKPFQSFAFTLFVKERVYNDPATREGIETIVKETLDSYLNGNRNLSKTDINTLLRSRTKGFVRTMSLDKFTEEDAEYIDLIETNSEISIRKSLTVTPEGYDITDDVRFNFVNIDIGGSDTGL